MCACALECPSANALEIVCAVRLADGDVDVGVGGLVGCYYCYCYCCYCYCCCATCSSVSMAGVEEYSELLRCMSSTYRCREVVCGYD